MRNSPSPLRSTVFALAVLTAGAAAAEQSPTGVWIDHDGRGGIEIKECSGKLCGHLVWFKDSAEVKNCGKQILGDVAPVGRNVWDNGWIYDPEKKQRFDLELKPLSADTLQVTGYAGLKFLSKTMVWKRAPADLTRCDAAKADTTDAASRPSAKNDEPPATASEPPPEKETAAAPRAGDALSDSEPPANNADRTARADAAPRNDDRPARREDDDEPSDNGASKGATKDCTLEVPYVTLTFPCKD